MGLSGVVREQEARQTFRAAGASIREAQVSRLKAAHASFKERLEQFVRERRSDLADNPALRLAFRQMCAAVGVDPMASARGTGLAELMGLDSVFGRSSDTERFYLELAVQVVETCLVYREATGGLVDFAAVKRRVQRLRGADTRILDSDIERAVQLLTPLGSGYTVIRMGESRLPMLQSVPRELSEDHSRLLGHAAGFSGRVEPAAACKQIGWTPARMAHAINGLQANGMLWMDMQADNPPHYWFPCLFLAQ